VSAPEKALVFAAGLGTRMRPITLTVPKPLVRIGKRTMLDHVLDRLAESGVAEAIVNVHWLADQVEDHLRDRTEPRIKISDERALLLDQGGGIVKVLAEFAGKPFLICNTDALWIDDPEPQVARLARAWDGSRMDVLLLLADMTTSVGVEGRGDFFRDAQGRLSRPAPGQPAPYVYSGVGIVKSSLFVDCPLEPFRLAPYFFAAAEQRRLFGLPLEGRWLHVGSPEVIDEAEKVFAAAATV
jgi:MurNAc alpha-1-phosphate uridylyltransferase